MNYFKNQPKLNVQSFFAFFLFLFLIFGACAETQALQQQPKERKTKVTIVGDKFFINGVPTYEGRTWTTSYGGEYPVEGLLMNARLVQGIFDDLNPDTRGQWVYPDTKQWDPDRNTQDFIDAMASWREHGLIGYTLNLQGGCPYGYCSEQRWDNSAYALDGSLRDGFMNRLERILDHSDDLGMVVILGYFYFGQDENLEDEAAIIRAVENATEWILEKGYTNVLIEINNECSHPDHQRYDHDILWCNRTHELIELVQSIKREGRSLYVSTSLSGGRVPPPNIIEISDFVFLHGNGVRDPQRIVEMSRQVREMDVYTTKPIVNIEDDQPWRNEEQGWGESNNNFVNSVKNYTSWGYFDFRRPEEADQFNEGYQSVPLNSFISSERKRSFFNLLAEITGSPGTPSVHMDYSQMMGVGTVRIEDEFTENPIEHIQVFMNNEVIATAQKAPFEFQLDKLPDGEHWIRTRAMYYNEDGQEIIIESPYQRNPWWPYGGRY